MAADLDVVVAEVEPLQRRQVGKSVDADAFDGALAHVQVLQSGQRREVTSVDRRTVERVAVEVELDRAGGDVRRHGAQPTPRTVDDVAGSVAEARLRTPRPQRQLSRVPGTAVHRPGYRYGRHDDDGYEQCRLTGRHNGSQEHTRPCQHRAKCIQTTLSSHW